MYFVTPSDPGITLLGIYETQIYGFGEKDGKLCIYTKSVFDNVGWKEFYLIDINVEKCECCKSGLHVATGLAVTRKSIAIWIAAREDKFTRIFTLDVDTKRFTRFKMLEELYPEFALLNLNLCCKCVSPNIRYSPPCRNFTSLVIVPQKYQSNVGIFRIRISINKSQHCLLWKKDDSFTLLWPPVSSNILVNVPGQEVLSVIHRSKDGRIQTLLIDYDDSQMSIYLRDGNGKEIIWHEVAFCDGFCLSRQKKEDGKSILNLYTIAIFQNGTPIILFLLDYCIVDANFPSIDSIRFSVACRYVDDEDYTTKRTKNKAFDRTMQAYIVPSFIVAQTATGIVAVPLRILSLSEAAYLLLAQIPQPHRPLPVVQITCIDYFFQRIHKIFGLKKKSKKEEDAPWMSQEFIKQKIGWPKILPLTNAPNLLMVNSK